MKSETGEKKNSEIIICGDFNTRTGRERGDFDEEGKKKVRKPRD